MIELAENGAISTKSAKRVVAVERNPLADPRSTKALPGSKIVEQDFSALISGSSMLRYPQGVHEGSCC